MGRGRRIEPFRRHPKSFFAFARACGTTNPGDAATQHLGATPVEIVERALNVSG
jgi:hypothetical protein